MTDSPIKSGLEIAPEFLQAIGSVATGWAEFECCLDSVMWVLAGVPDITIGGCITAQIPNSARKLDAIIALSGVRSCDEAVLKDLRSLAGKAENLQRRRNRVVHDMWRPTDKTGTHYRLEITAAKTLVFQQIEIPLEEIQQCASAIMRLSDDFWNLKDRVMNDPKVAASLGP